MSTYLELVRDAGESNELAPTTPIRVMLADDHAMMRRCLRLLLEGEEGLEVVGEAADVASVLRHAGAQRPQVIVLDISMPGGSSLDAIGRLRASSPKTHVIALTMDDNPVFAQRALAAGASGYIVKELADDELSQAVRAVARGQQFVSPRVSARLDALNSSLVEDKLTPREAEVLRLIALGHTTVEIARKLHLSPRTIETHRARIHARLGLSTRAELVHYSLRRGLLRP